MSSAENLREFVTERLTAAAEEIFGAFKQTIVEYEKEIDRQRRLLDVVWKPEIRLERIESPQKHVCKEEEEEKGLANQQLCHQERDSSLDQEDPEPPQIKEEPEELCNSPAPTYEESDHSEPEPKSDHQLLSYDSPAAVSQDQREGKHGDWRSTQNAEPNPKERHHTDRSHSDNNDNCNLLEIYPDSYINKKSVECCTGGKAYKYEYKFNVHMKSHTGEKPYLCKTCGKRFSKMQTLKRHMRIHTGEKPYSCSTCGKHFRSSGGLSEHKRTHTGEKPHHCKICGKGFGVMTRLKIHMRTHTGEKPYLCNTCGKRFVEKTTLTRHTRTHTGERPHICKTCGKGFIELSKLKAHMTTHTAEKPYICTTCGKNFFTPGALNRHSVTHTEKATPLQDLWEKITSETIIGYSCKNPHGQETVPLQELWEKIPSESINGQSCANLHGQEAVPLQDLREKIHSAVKTESPHDTHSGEKPYFFKAAGQISYVVMS